ncbi:SRPBCC domain-containing protein [Siminovitchia fortis]|uniref:SRPBCC domain-containing protein n=1 Tax=Siminovitchia fortis TaxID=254758 RepID=UPI0011A8B8D5|nr:SRPBCC domain-containing protein [Siminovitchia fortis]
MSKNETETISRVENLSLIVERVYNMPQQLVWDAWTKPEHVSLWWGYRGVPLYVCNVDLRQGGSYRYVQKEEDGTEYPFIGNYLEVDTPNRLVYTQIFDVEPFNEHESVTYDTFEEIEEEKTKLTSRTEFKSAEALQGALDTGMEQGAIDSMERFAKHLEKI